MFQALVNDILRDMLNNFVFVYLDDILIFSQNLDQHIFHVCTVLQHLLQNQLYVKAEKNYSVIAAPLHQFTSVKKPYIWTSDAEFAFNQLYQQFTTAPVLCMPDPTRQFLVEVDASDYGVDAVFSQRSPDDSKVHPCAYFSISTRVSSAEHNYDIGN